MAVREVIFFISLMFTPFHREHLSVDRVCHLILTSLCSSQTGEVRQATIPPEALAEENARTSSEGEVPETDIIKVPSIHQGKRAKECNPLAESRSSGSKSGVKFSLIHFLSILTT